MKICLATWAPFVAGAEVAAERLAVGLQNVGHDVLIAVGTDGDALDRFKAAGLRCVNYQQRFTDKLHWLSYQRAKKTLGTILAREEPDIVHSNDLPTHQMASDAARRLGIPVICHHRWLFEGSAIDWFSKYGAARHLFVSRALMDNLCRKSPRLAASPRSVIYDGLPLPVLPSADDRLAARQQLNLPTDKQIILFAGQIIERKGIADLLYAWSKLTEPCQGGAELVVVGDDVADQGSYRRQMEQLAQSLKCPARFVGFQNNVAPWLKAADVVCVPSHAEPLGNATLEAMAHGVPVIGSDIGGIPEMIVDQQTGLLVPPKSPVDLSAALEHLLSHPELRTQLGNAARRRCEQLFSLPHHVEQVLEQYHIVLDRELAGALR